MKKGNEILILFGAIAGILILNELFKNPAEGRITGIIEKKKDSYQKNNIFINGDPELKTYVATDKRYTKRKELPELLTLSRKGIIFTPYEENLNIPLHYDSAEVYLIPLEKIYIRLEKFQQRQEDYSEKSVQKIINAVTNNTFKWEVFDPILLWNDPGDNKLYVLAGHSRTEAFKRLYEQGKTYQGRKFDKIPSKIIQTSEEEAEMIAKKSNVLATGETLIERAEFYRDLRKKGIPEKEIFAEARQNEDKNATTIISFSHLNPDGYAYQSLKSLQEADPHSRKIAETISDWCGRARMDFPGLTDQHENELFDWLTHGAYGNKPSQINNYLELRKRIYNIVTKDYFDFNKPLNIKLIRSESYYDIEKSRLENELKAAQKSEFDKIKELRSREATREQIEKLTELNRAEIRKLQNELISLSKNKSRIIESEKAQMDLFSITGISTRFNFFL